MAQRNRGEERLREWRQHLIATAAKTGGWPYYQGHNPRLEPTCWALLALDAPAADERALVDRSWSFLRGLQTKDGLLVEADGPGPNYAWNGLALVAGSRRTDPADTPDWNQVAAGLLAVKGIVIEGESPVRQNNRLQGWPWTEQTFSWIEPTSYCLLGLKRRGDNSALARTRITEAEAVILDRVCDAGGWNYGNAQVLSQDLRPYVPTTALALLAMQDRREHPVIRKSLEWLTSHATNERSAMALSLSAISLHAYGHSIEPCLALLAEQREKTAFLGNAHLTAMALYALSLPARGAQTFTVTSR